MYKDGQRHAQPDLQPTCNQLATDCISRQDVIELVKNSFYDLSSSMDDTWAMVADVERLPSVQPVAKDTNVLNNDTISRAEAIDVAFDIFPDDEYFREQFVKSIEALPSAQPDLGKYEYHYDHTDCIWYRPEARNRCPVTCAQYRDGWNDAMNYIFRDGKGYRPYRRDKQYEE